MPLINFLQILADFGNPFLFYLFFQLLYDIETFSILFFF